MEPTAATTAAIPPIPLPVEESRAKRLQRQQARFRDRGGIFVPSNRNTLIDILLGRKAQSPLKRRSRSLSCSPVKSKPKEFPVGGQKATTIPALASKRTSPRKKPLKKQADEQEASEPIAGPSKPAASVKKARKVKEKTDETPAAPKRRGRPPKAKNGAEATASRSPVKATNEEIDLDQKPKSRKRATTTSTKPAAKKGRPRKKKEEEMTTLEDDEDGADEVAIDRSSTSKSTASKAKSKEKRKKVPPSKSTLDTGTDESLPGRARSRRDKGVYQELSDDDAIPAAKPLSSKKVEEVPPPVRKPPDKRGKERQQLASTEVEGSPRPPEAEDPVEIRLSSKKRIRPHTDDASVKDDDSGPRKRARADPQPSTESADIVAKKPRTKKAQVNQANSKARKRTNHDKEASDDSDNGTTTKQARAKRTKDTDHSTKKSRSTKPKNEVDSQKEAKRPSEITESPPPGRVSPPKKRPFEAVSGDLKKPSTKRKKVTAKAGPPDAMPHHHDDPKVSHSKRSGQGVTLKLKESGGSAKASKPASKQSKSSTKSAPIVVPRRPPKSVLERIKAPRPQIEDDAPDPIDFLS